MKNTTPAVSVVIPCYNGIDSIGKTLDAILKQETTFDFEVILVDSSKDGTDRFVAKEFPQVRLIHLGQQTLPGSGRNLGILEAKGEIVLFTDADCVPKAGWIEGHYRTHQDVNCVAVGGSVINGYPRHYVAWVSHLIEFNEWTPESKRGKIWNNPSCNLSLKREAFLKLHVEFTDNWPDEDTLFNWEVREKGGEIYFNPDLTIIHLNRMAFGKLFHHQYRLGKAVAVERQITTLPGKIFLKVPILCLGLPFARWLFALIRLLKTDLKTSLIFIWITPLFLCAAMAWSIGFMVKGEPRDAVIHIFEA